MGHPLAFGTYAAILGTVGMHIGFDASDSSELMAQIPLHLASGSGTSLADWLAAEQVSRVVMEATRVYGGRCGMSWRIGASMS